MPKMGKAPGPRAVLLPLAAGPESLDVWQTQVPIGRMIEPEEIASAILFLASDAASAATGHLPMADGASRPDNGDRGR